MASESNSAVLDLNDPDTTEETDGASITDVLQDAVPLIMEHGYDIAVKVDAPMKQLSTMETFVTYRVRTVCARWQVPSHVRRRYNHFKVLHKRLSQAHPLLAVPPLPPLHSARQQLDRYSASFVAVRTLALDAFLNRVAKHPILTHSDDFRIFLTTPDEELDKVFKSESGALNLWGLGSVLYGSGESKPTNGARVKDPEFTAASDYLQSLQQKLTTLCTITNKLYKGSTSLSDDHMNMKRVCDVWASRERGRISASASGMANASETAAAARRPLPRQHLAVLPMLAAYCGALTDKYRQRETLHAAYVADANSSGELQNRLEQASEALRSEFSDWLPKTHNDVKSLLLDLADRQVNMHTHILMGWEKALKLSSETNIDEIFKTVSKTAVQNLSPSKCQPDGLTPTETDKDFDDIDVLHDSNDDSEEISRIQDDSRNDYDAIDEVLADLRDDKEDDVEKKEGIFKNEDDEIDRVLSGLLNEKEKIENDKTQEEANARRIAEENSSNSKLDCDTDLDPLGSFADVNDSSSKEFDDISLNADNKRNDNDKVHDTLKSSVVLKEEEDDNMVSNSNQIKSESNLSSNAILDPLQSFSDVDLSS